MHQIELSAHDIDGRRTRIGAGPAGYAYVFEPPDRITRIVGYDERERPIEGSLFLDQLYTWHAKGNRIFLFDAKHDPVRDPERRRRLGDWARAAMASFRMERLRHGNPELFRGARGILVSEVEPGGAGERVGLQPGDILLSYNGFKLSRPYDLDRAKTSAIATAQPGVEMLVLCHGKVISHAVVPRPLALDLEYQ